MESLFYPLQQALLTYLDVEQVALVRRAYLLAAKAHKNQQRGSGEPYITHPLAAAHILCDLRLDYQSIAAALLHDTMEDTLIKKTQLIEEFGEEIADLVDGVSKLTQIEFTTRSQAQAENFRKMLLAMNKDIRVILVKLADRLHNMRTLAGLPPEKRCQKAIETFEIYAPIASRLGIYTFKTELEDLSFKAIHPWRYRILEKTMASFCEQRKKVLQQIQTTLEQNLHKYEIPVTVRYHQRHLYSFYKKMKEEHLSFKEISDFYSFRIVVDKIDDCYRALGIIHNIYRPIPEHFRDYIAIPKKNDYQALHTTLFGLDGTPIEIQIRTTDIDNKAENGIIAYWKFQKGKGLKTAQSNAQQWLHELIELQHQNKEDSFEFLESIKMDLSPKEVYVFTPKGEIITLPQGSTLVDFAYAIHSDIGNTCIASKIDKRLVPLSNTLVNGQTVEIITAPGARPNPAWLNFVVTAKARSHIKNYLKELQHTESIALGKRLLKRTLKALGTTIENIPENTFHHLMQELNYPKENALFEAIGLGNQMASFVALKLTDQSALAEKIKKKKKRSLIIKGGESSVITFAECCHPIPSDPITGFFEKGRGIIIHVKGCRKFSSLKRDPECYLPVRWEEAPEGAFKVSIRIEVIDQRGVLAEITTAIADMDANIEDIDVEQQDGNYCSLDIILSVSNRTHLARVLRRLRTVKSVSRLARQ